jgi:large subunit ribosomal protein L10
MNRDQKQSFVEDFKERMEKAPVFYLTDFTGLNVKDMTTLRHKLQASGSEYLVVKNRLVIRALQDTELPDISEHLQGPTGVVLGYEGPVESAKALTEFAKEHGDRPVFKVGVLDNKILAPNEIERLAKLPSREVLLAQLAGALEGPMAALAGALEGKLQEMAGLLESLRAQREEG